MVKGSILFPIDKEVDLVKLGEEIIEREGFVRWQDSRNKSGFSGLDLDEVEVDGTPYKRVLIIWSDDGNSGYVRDDLNEALKTRVKGVIERHRKHGNR